MDPNRPSTPNDFDMASSFVVDCILNFILKGGSLSNKNKNMRGNKKFRKEILYINGVDGNE